MMWAGTMVFYGNPPPPPPSSSVISMMNQPSLSPCSTIICLLAVCSIPEEREREGERKRERGHYPVQIGVISR